MELGIPEFVVSAHSLDQLPSEDLPEIAFAGRSNVGKSSLLNCLFQRKHYVKVSSRPGKTQGLNVFQIAGVCSFVDLPGYGYAKVSKQMQARWSTLVHTYLESRRQLRGVVLIMDLRHQAKAPDGDLLRWLRQRRIPHLAVYTKADKLSGNQRNRLAASLDAGHGLSPSERVVCSAVTGMGRAELVARLKSILAIA